MRCDRLKDTALGIPLISLQISTGVNQTLTCVKALQSSLLCICFLLVMVKYSPEKLSLKPEPVKDSSYRKLPRSELRA